MLFFQLALVFFSTHSYASEDELRAKDEGRGITLQTCESFFDFHAAHEFLKKEKDLALNDDRIIRLSLEISRGCTGAFSRFEKTYLLMKNSGVDLKKSIQIGKEFSALTDDQAKNFVDVFKGVYLENYYNFDFPLAFKVSQTLSKNVRDGAADLVRKDFVQMLKFCVSQKQMNLPLGVCANVALRLCEHSWKFSKVGAFPDFESFYMILRTEDGFGLSTQEAVELALNVVQYGPKAIPNFTSAFQFAREKKGLGLSAKAALKIGVELAKQSLAEPSSNKETSPSGVQ